MTDAEALRLIHEELTSINSRLEAVEGNLSGIQVAISEFVHDVEGKNERRDQEVQRIRERLDKLEGKAGAAAGPNGR
jgi:hypothetical protein